MGNDKLEINAAIMISKPAGEVYEAIVDPAKMTNYFISKSSGRMEEEKTITWQFPEMDMEFPVQVKKPTPVNTFLIPGLISEMARKHLLNLRSR